MGVVAALLVFEVARVGVGVAVIVRAVFAHEALVARPGLDQGAVHAEVLAREQFLLLGLLHDLVEELDDRIVLDQAFAVLAEHGRNPDCIVHGQADEPAKQQVVLGLLHELALRAHAVEHLNEHGPQQFLGGNAGTPAFDVSRVHLTKQVVHVRQGLVDHQTDHAQGVIKGHEVIEVAHGEQALGEGVGSAHGWLFLLSHRWGVPRLSWQGGSWAVTLGCISAAC